MIISEKEFAELCKKNPALNRYNTQTPSAKTNKYRNVKIYVYASGAVLGDKSMTDKFGPVIDVFDSQKEYLRYKELVLLERAGKISKLKRQVPITIQEKCCQNGSQIKAIVYKADFCYIRGGKEIVEDVKPLDKASGKYRLTKDFSLKWKLLKAKYPNKTFEIF